MDSKTIWLTFPSTFWTLAGLLHWLASSHGLVLGPAVRPCLLMSGSYSQVLELNSAPNPVRETGGGEDWGTAVLIFRYFCAIWSFLHLLLQYVCFPNYLVTAWNRTINKEKWCRIWSGKDGGDFAGPICSFLLLLLLLLYLFPKALIQYCV